MTDNMYQCYLERKKRNTWLYPNHVKKIFNVLHKDTDEWKYEVYLENLTMHEEEKYKSFSKVEQTHKEYKKLTEKKIK